MSIKNEIERIQFNVSSAYSAVESKGGELPERKNSDNLAEAIAAIPAGSGEAAGFGEITVSVDGTSGSPAATVETSGPNTAKNIAFYFTGLKGAPGVDGNHIGTIISYIGKTAPDGYLVCDGETYPIDDYPQLADFFEAQYGDKAHFGGDGDTDFAVPTLTESDGVLRCIKAYDDAGAYSLEETRIGTWIDGKPIYRQVLYFENALSASGSPFLVSEHIDNCIKFHAWYYVNGEWPKVNTGFYVIRNDNLYYAQQVSSSATYIQNLYIVMEYTKSTDEPTIEIPNAGAQFGFDGLADGIYASYASDVLPRDKQRNVIEGDAYE